jgi:CRISPR system Cascade subunit CasE
MYLSRVEINPRRRDTIRALSSPQIMHAAIQASFPSGNSSKFRNIWRIDKLPDALYIILQSHGKPDFTHIIEQFGWPASEQTSETVEYDRFLSHLQNGQEWRFRLRANPVYSNAGLIRVNEFDGEDVRTRGKIVAHTTVSMQRQWLLKKSMKSGFEIVSTDDGSHIFDVTQSEINKFSRQGKVVTIATAVFDGILEITDAKLFADTIKNGIGRAKAYGCGLLTLARIARDER